MTMGKETKPNRASSNVVDIDVVVVVAMVIFMIRHGILHKGIVRINGTNVIRKAATTANIIIGFIPHSGSHGGGG